MNVGPIQLSVFDFDGTLFRSPNPPPYWGEKGAWWRSLKSLSEPNVPEHPSIDWWNESVVEGARRALQRRDTRTILLSGRGPEFSLRLRTLLSQVGLNFEEMYLNPGEETEVFKLRVIDEILSEQPSIRGVSIWEDRDSHLRIFADWVESKGRACFPHLITVSAHPLSETASAQRVAARYKKKTKDDEGNVHYEYSDRQVKNRHNQKAERVEQLRKDLSKLREKVRRDLSSKDPKTALSALAVSLIDETCERVGNEGSAKEGHFGVTGWQKGHVSFSSGKATLEYVGKSGVSHEKTVESAPVVKKLRELSKGKSEKDALLSDGDFKIKPEHVNSYLEEFGVSAKDIRGLRANQEMCRALREQRRRGPKLPHGRKEKDKILKKEFAAALEEVAGIVGHEEATLRSDYLVPGLEDAYVKDGTVLASFKEATKSDSEREEEKVEKLVKPSPRKKPPRDDLRKRRIEDEDSDLEKKDDDLSLNYKKVAFRLALSVRLASRFRLGFSSENDSEFSDFVDGKTFRNPETDKEVQFNSLPSSEQKKIRERWEEDSDESDSQPVEKSPEEDSKELVEKALSVEESPAFSKEDGAFVKETLSKLTEGQDPAQGREFVESLIASRKRAIDKLSEGGSPYGSEPVDPDDLSKDVSRLEDLSKEIEGLERSFSDTQAERIQSLKEKKEKLRTKVQKDFSRYFVYAATIEAARNPMTFIGESSSPLDSSEVSDRAKVSVRRFRDMTPEDRERSAESFQRLRVSTRRRIEELEEEEASGGLDSDPGELERLKNRLEYLDSDFRSLELASAMEGDEGESSIPSGTRQILRALKDSGLDTLDVVDSGIGLYRSEPDAQVVSDLVRRLRPDQMGKVLEFADPSGKLEEAWKKSYEGGPSYVWPLSKIQDRAQRRRVEETHEVLSELLTDMVIEDSAKGRVPGKPKKERSKAPSSDDFSSPDEVRFDKSEPYVSKVLETMEKLDIDVD